MPLDASVPIIADMDRMRPLTPSMRALLSTMASHPGSRLERRPGWPGAVALVDRHGRCCLMPCHWATVAGLLARGRLCEQAGTITADS